MSIASKKLANILIAEDNEGDIILTKSLLGDDKVEINIHYVRDGQEVIEFLKQSLVNKKTSMPNLIFLDINMPRMGGLELLNLIYKNENFQYVKICMLSGSENEIDIQKSKELGAIDYLLKPLDCNKLKQVINQIENLYYEERDGRTYIFQH